MFSLLRTGPKILIIETVDTEKLRTNLIKDNNAVKCTLNMALETSSEESTILLLVEKIKDIINLKDISETLTLKMEPDAFLCNIINSKNKDIITHSRLAPRILLMRAFGNIEKVLSEVKNDHNGTIGNFLDILDNTNDSGTVVLLSQDSLNKNMTLKDTYYKCVFIQDDYFHLVKQLRSHSLKYLNDGIENKNWYELEIKIYDRYSAYSLHYKRLLKVLESLEIGLILGESWGKDYPRFLMSVGIYKIRFFTFHEPNYIKKLLVGLEHLEDGTRIVDYDLYFNKKRIYWVENVEKDANERQTLSKKYRDFIFEKLSKEDKEYVLLLEKEILETRK